MGLIQFGNAIVLGNFSKLSKQKPKDWIGKEYKIIVSFNFKWRHKIGKVECTCTVCEEHYQPYYGFSWYHSKECELIKYIEKRPQILNLRQCYGWDFHLIAQSE